MLRVSSVLGFAALLLAGCGSVYKPALEPYEIESTDFPLPSGLRVIFQEDHTRPTVTIVSVVDAGTMQDPEGKEGIAHLVEHMCFRARHDGKTQVMDIIKGVGGAFNAYTADERTVYLTTAPKEALGGLLRIEALRMLNPVANIEDRVLDIEREVVRNELRVRTETNIGNRMFEVMEELLFPPGHGRNRTGIGTHETLSSITMDDVRAFASTHYVPAKTTIVVSGDFDRAQAAAMLQNAFPPALVTADGKPMAAGKRIELITPKARVNGAAPAVPKPHGDTLRRITGPVEEPTVVLGWLVPGGFRGDDTMMQTAAQYLSSFLNYTMRSRTEKTVSLTTGVGCGVAPGIDASVLYCVAGIAPGEIDVDDMLDRARGAPALSWQWADSRAQYDTLRAALGSRLLSELAYDDRVERIALHAHYLGGTDAYARAFAELTDMDIEQQRDFIYTHLTRERMVALIIEPEAKKTSDGPAFDGSASWSGAVFEGNADLDAIYARMTPAVIEAAATPPTGPEVVEFTLPNGLPVIIVPHPGAPLVRVSLFRHGGSLSTMPLHATDYLSIASDAIDPTRFTGSWASTGSVDHEAVGIEAPSGNLRAAIEVLGTQMKTLRARAPGQNVRKQVRFRAEVDARRMALDPAYAAQVAFNAALYRNHPLGAHGYDVEALAALDEKWARELVNSRYAPGNSTLLVVGDIDPAEARPIVEASFGDWRADDRGAKVNALPPPPATPPARSIVFRARPDATQAEIAVGCLVDGSPSSGASRSVLGAALRTDLWRSLRENTGSSYSPFAGTAVYANGNASLQVRATVQTDQAVRSLSAILGRLEALSKGGIGLADLRNAQWSLARRTMLSNRTPGAVTATIARALRDGRTMADLAKGPAELAAVDGASIGKVLDGCVGHEVVGIVGPPSLAEALATFGEVTLVK